MARVEYDEGWNCTSVNRMENTCSAICGHLRAGALAGAIRVLYLDCALELNTTSNMAEIPSFTLNDGSKIPSIGMGCWMGGPGGGQRVYDMCSAALEVCALFSMLIRFSILCSVDIGISIR